MSGGTRSLTISDLNTELCILYMAGQILLFAPADRLKDSQEYSSDPTAYDHRYPLGHEPVNQLVIAKRFSDEDSVRAVYVSFAAINRHIGKINILTYKPPKEISKNKDEWIGSYKPIKYPPLQDCQVIIAEIIQQFN